MPFHPKKSLGQNFLTNPRVVQKIIETSELTGNELVVEIGPGFGILTEALLKNVKKVIAIEKDHILFLSLRGRTSEASALYKNLTLIHADALKILPPHEPYFLISNIPYSITSPLLDHFIRKNPANLPKRAVLLVQKEVAQKICAKPPRMNVLALHVQVFGNPKIMAVVSRNNFRPRPKVDSAILKIDFPGHPRGNSGLHYENLFSIIHRGFTHKRKMLRTAFDIACLKTANLDPTSRPESLSIENWISLAKTLPGYS